MKAVKKIAGIKRVLALAAVLSMAGTGWAKRNNGSAPVYPETELMIAP